MVEPEQVLERVRVRGFALERVEHRQLAVQQCLVAPCEVEEHLVDRLAERGLADGGLDGGALGRREGLGDVGDLGGPADVQRKRLIGDVHVVPSP
ncbi:hypothetical protein GCM10029978_029030 [Actinoallomurus acanthiterrae]